MELQQNCIGRAGVVLQPAEETSSKDIEDSSANAARGKLCFLIIHRHCERKRCSAALRALVSGTATPAFAGFSSATASREPSPWGSSVSRRTLRI